MPVTKRQRKRIAQDAITAIWDEKNAQQAAAHLEAVAFIDSANREDALHRLNEELENSRDWWIELGQQASQGKIHKSLYDRMKEASKERLWDMGKAEMKIMGIAPYLAKAMGEELVREAERDEEKGDDGVVGESVNGDFGGLSEQPMPETHDQGDDAAAEPTTVNDTIETISPEMPVIAHHESQNTKWLVLTAPAPTKPQDEAHTTDPNPTQYEHENMVREISRLRTRSERRGRAIKRLTKKNRDLEARQAALEVQNTLALSHQIVEPPSDDEDAPSAKRIEAALRADLSEAFGYIKECAFQFMDQSTEQIMKTLETVARGATQVPASTTGDESRTDKDTMDERMEALISKDEIADMKARLLVLETQLEKLGLSEDKKGVQKDEMGKAGAKDEGDAKKTNDKNGGKRKRNK